MYSIVDAFSDCSFLEQKQKSVDWEFERNALDSAMGRLEKFVTELSPQQIANSYLDLALLFWRAPFKTSVELAHNVIEKFLLPEESWADIYLWAFSALRMVPVEDTQWISRNYLAAALQALGENERAEWLLRQSWQSHQIGSMAAYGWLFGVDPGETGARAGLNAITGNERPTFQFQSLKAKWLDKAKITAVENNVLPSMSKEASEDAVIAHLQNIDADKGLLRWCLELAAEYSGDVRQIAVLGMFRGCTGLVGLTDPSRLVEMGEELFAIDAAPHLIYERFALATLFEQENAYLPAIDCLISLDCQESALGLAKVAVWLDIEGAANSLVALLGIDKVKVSFPEGEISQAMVVQLYQMAAGNN
jgi:hypothetical protein